MSQYLVNINTELSHEPAAPAEYYNAASEVLETEVLENHRNVFKVELLEDFPSDIVNARTVIIEWCVNNSGTDYRFIISRMDHTSTGSNSVPGRLTGACKDIDVHFDDDKEEIIVRYKYINSVGQRDKTAYIYASYFRPLEKFKPHTQTNQKDALKKFLKCCARRTGSHEETVWVFEKSVLFENYEAKKPEHIPNVELSSEPAQIRYDVLKMHQHRGLLPCAVQRYRLLVVPSEHYTNLCGS